MLWIDFFGGMFLALVVVYFCSKQGIFAINLKIGEHDGKGNISQVNYFRELCREAGEAVYVLSGETAHVFWDNDQVIAIIDEAIARGIKFYICAGPWFDVKSKRLARFINEGKIFYYKLNQRNDEIHYWANDKCHIACHDPREHNKEHTITGSRFINWKYIKRFLRFSQGLTPITKGKFPEAFWISDPNKREKFDSDYQFTNKDYVLPAAKDESNELIGYLH